MKSMAQNTVVFLYEFLCASQECYQNSWPQLHVSPVSLNVVVGDQDKIPGSETLWVSDSCWRCELNLDLLGFWFNLSWGWCTRKGNVFQMVWFFRKEKFKWGGDRNLGLGHTNGAKKVFVAFSVAFNVVLTVVTMVLIVVVREAVTVVWSEVLMYSLYSWLADRDKIHVLWFVTKSEAPDLAQSYKIVSTISSTQEQSALLKLILILYPNKRFFVAFASHQKMLHCQHFFINLKKQESQRNRCRENQGVLWGLRNLTCE